MNNRGMSSPWTPRTFGFAKRSRGGPGLSPGHAPHFSEPRRWVPAAVIAALLLFHAVNTVVWLRMDQMLPFDDQAFHLLAGLRCLEILQQPGWDLFARLLDITAEEFYPPGFHICMGLFNLFGGGPSLMVSRLANLPFWALLLVSLYGIGRRISNPRAGLLAAALVSMYPYVFGLSKMSFPDFAVTAMVAWSLSCLLATEGFAKRRESVVLGLSLGLGMLVKQVFLGFLLPPLLVGAVEAFRRSQPSEPVGVRGRRIANLALAAGIGLLMAGSWYLRQLPVLLPGYRRMLLHEGPLFGPTQVFSMESLRFYAEQLVTNQILWFFAALFLMGFAVVLWERGRGKWYLIWSVVGAYLIFTLINAKEPKTTVPYLPAVALISAVGLLRIRPPFARRLAVSAAVLVGLVQYAAISYVPPDTPVYAVLRRTPVVSALIPPRLTFIMGMRHVYQTGEWRMDELVELLEREQPALRTGVVAVTDQVGELAYKTVVPWPDSYVMTNEKTVAYFCRANGLRYSVLSLTRGPRGWIEREGDWPDVFVIADEIGAVVPEPIAERYILVSRLAMLDESPVYVYKKRDALAAVDVRG